MLKNTRVLFDKTSTRSVAVRSSGNESIALSSIVPSRQFSTWGDRTATRLSRPYSPPPKALAPTGSFGKKMTMYGLVRRIPVNRQDEPLCSAATVDGDFTNAFKFYIAGSLAFVVKRAGFLYGRVDDETTEVLVDFIYEPLSTAPRPWPQSPEQYTRRRALPSDVGHGRRAREGPRAAASHDPRAGAGPMRCGRPRASTLEQDIADHGPLPRRNRIPRAAAGHGPPRRSRTPEIK